MTAVGKVKSVESRVHDLKASLASIIVSYSLCSSTLLLVNKFVLRLFPAPSTILAAQCFFTAFAVRFASIIFRSQKVENISNEDLRLFIIVVTCFVGTLFSNAKALQFTNVDTVIGLRLTMPLITSVLEYIFLGRELPSKRSSLALFGVAASFSYHIFENGRLPFQSIFWLGLWYFWTIFEGVFVKHVVTVSKLSTWSKTYYLNIFSMVVFAFMALLLDTRIIQDASGTVSHSLIFSFTMSLSCFLGFGMSYLSFMLRQEISATTFNMIGNICKILTIALNSIIWNLHASPAGITSILFCIGFTTMYSQAPMRARQDALSSESDGNFRRKEKPTQDAEL